MLELSQSDPNLGIQANILGFKSTDFAWVAGSEIDTGAVNGNSFRACAS
ncbi:hypothetical protein ACFFYR_19945 [Paraburkholderia dipogonis]